MIINMRFQLKSKFKPAGDQPEAIKKLTAGLARGDDFQTLLGVTGSGKTFTIANVIANVNKPTLVIAPNKALAAQLYQEYKTFFPNNAVCYFVSYYDYYQPEAYMPVTDTYIDKEAIINEEIDRLRHMATAALTSRKDVIVVASVSCIYNLGVPEIYFSSAIHLEVGQMITREDLIHQLLRVHFKRNNLDLKRGDFRVRGDLFELIPASGEMIYQIELENQKIKKLAVIDSLTRHVKEVLNDVLIFPIKHFVATEPERNRAIKDITDEMNARIKYFQKTKQPLEAERIEKKTKNDLTLIKTLGFCHGIENYSRHFTGSLPGQPPETLLSYFGDDFLTVIDESHITIPQIGGMYEGDRSRKETLIEYGFRLPSALDNRPLKFAEFMSRISQTIFTTATPKSFEKERSKQIVEQIIRPTYLVDPEIEIKKVFDQKKNWSQIDDIVAETKKVVAEKGRVLINTLTKKTAEELSDYLNNLSVKNTYIHSDTKTLERTEIMTDFRKGIYHALVGVNLLREGLDFPEVALVAILDADREGFLRSDIALIQLMGRAARNSRGRIIIYADQITGSIKRAIAEAARRRKTQLEHNEKYNLKPKSIKKGIETMIKLENLET